MQKKYALLNGKVVESQDVEGPILVFVDPDEQERSYLTEYLKIDEHTLASALDPDELSRLEFEPTHVALIVKRPKSYSAEEQFLFRVSSMGLFLFENRLVVVVSESDPVFEGKPFIAMQSIVDVMLRLIYRSIFHFLRHLKVINMVVEELEQKINASMENRYLLNLFSLEKSLVYYLNAIHTNGVLIAKVKNYMSRIGIKDEQSEFLDDILIENEQCYRLAEIYTNVLASMMDARASIVNNNLSVLMKTLNIITIGIMMPNLVIGLFSMNVQIPFAEGVYGFWVIMGLAAASTAGVMAVWRYKRFW